MQSKLESALLNVKKQSGLKRSKQENLQQKPESLRTPEVSKPRYDAEFFKNAKK